MNSPNREHTKKTKFKLYTDRDKRKREKSRKTKRFLETIRKMSEKEEADHAMLAT